MFKSNNLTARIFEREIRRPMPGTSVHRARKFYENILPTCTIYDVECPNVSFRKFSDDGRYLITFSRNLQDLMVYRPKWLSYSYKKEEDSIPASSKNFRNFFTLLYSVPLASSEENICKDFFLYVEDYQFGLFATSTVPVHDTPATGGAIDSVPISERITFSLVRLEDGVTLDTKILTNDFVLLAAQNLGVYLYDDLLAIASLRYQTIHIIQIRESGNLVDLRTIGAFCNEDDELFLRSYSQPLTSRENGRISHSLTSHADSGIPANQIDTGNMFLSGIKQRLLSFIFRTIWNEEMDDDKRVQNLKKKFYFHFQDYTDLIIWKVQFLDRHHLLIKFVSVDGGVTRTADHRPSFFAVYNMDSTEFIAFYQNSSEELYYLYEQFFDHFNATSRASMRTNFISSHSNNAYALEQLRATKIKASTISQFVKKKLGSFPSSCQSLSVSPYFDQSLFQYDDKLISATDRHRPPSDHPIKFKSRRPPYALKFKIKHGPESGNTDARVKKICSFVFHPFLPLALSVQTMQLQSSVNIHFRG